MIGSGESDVYYSVVVPMYNEAGNLRELHARLSGVMKMLDRSYEIIFIDDGSTDESVLIMRALQENDAHLRIISFLRNFGQHPAAMAGFERARGQVIITLDADLQNPPEELPKLLAALDQGYDVATGCRKRRQDSPMRTLPSLVINWMLAALTGVALKDYGCMMRAYRRHVIDYLKLFPEKAKYVTVLASWLRVKISEVEIDQSARKVGVSRYNYLKLIRLTLDLLTGFSITPILVVSAVGIVLLVLGSALGFSLFIWRLTQGPAELGLPMLAALMLVLSGVQLMAVGLIGEYVGRTFIAVQDRPSYIVKAVFEPSDLVDEVASGSPAAAVAQE